MAVTMDLEESASDSKLHKDSAAKKELRPSSAVSFSKSEHGPILCAESSSTEQLKQFKSWVSNERWNELKKIADAAMKERKVFMIKGGGFPAIRRALLERGWIEKYESHKVLRLLNVRHPPPTLDPKKATGKELSKVERMILYKFMEQHSVDFLWTTKRDKYDWLLSNKDVLISRFSRSIFTTKEGLTASLTQMHWYTEPGISLTKFPRCYNIHNSDSLEEFVDDFRITACISVLKWLTTTLTQSNDQDLIAQNGKVPFSAIEFAISRLNEYIQFFTHKDIDDTEDQSHIWEHEWDQFLTHHYLLVHEKAKFLEEKNNNVRQLERKGAKILAMMTKFWPQIDIDGVLNIWIVKPGNKCRGRGIQLMNNIKDIIGLINIPSCKTRYVVQKYIENPLVIYNTKFDIRQWFLITNCQPLTIWVYKDSYLRFSSQIFSLSNYHESVHLTNNAVQTKYKNYGERDKALPDENMWDCHTFKAYLRQIGKYEMWDSKIYPGMKQCLIGAMLACQDTMDKRQNSFELYGADFMLTEDFTPWLIEINSSPDLAPTTSVTARLCPQCLEDVIKVVLDRRYNPDADTGTFELAYRQCVPKAPAYLGLSLCINGKRMIKKTVKERKHETRSVTPIAPRVPSGDHIPEDHPIPPEYTGPIITDFLTWLNPYDAIPTNKDGIVLPNESLTVRQAVTVIKSGITFKNSSKKRKSSAHSFRTHRGRREKNIESKRRVVRHSCCQPDESKSENTGKFRTESASKTEKPKRVDRSVGNKRCYIDPDEWERETASILRSTISVQNKVANRTEPVIPIRQTKSSLASSTRRSSLVPLSSRKSNDESDPIKKLSAIGRSICKLHEESRSKQKSISFSKSCTSIYGPYRVVITPLNDEPLSSNKRKKCPERSDSLQLIPHPIFKTSNRTRSNLSNASQVTNKPDNNENTGKTMPHKKKKNIEKKKASESSCLQKRNSTKRNDNDLQILPASKSSKDGQRPGSSSKKIINRARHNDDVALELYPPLRRVDIIIAPESSSKKRHYYNKKCANKYCDNGGVKRIYSPFNRFANSYNRNADRDMCARMPLDQNRQMGLSSKEKSYLICSCQKRTSRYLKLKTLAANAIKQNKIFTICGCCNVVRRALIERGWVEKITPNKMNLSKIRNGTFFTKSDINNELERLLLSNLVEKQAPNFIWQSKEAQNVTFIDMSKDNAIVNKLKVDALWTSKQGLCSSMKQNDWFYIENIAEVNSPRTYNSYDSGEIEAFVNDFQITACTSLLKWVLSMVANDRPVFVKTGKISMNVVVFALNRCKEYLFRKQHKDIDRTLCKVSSGQWKAFMKKYYRIVAKDDVFASDKDNKLPLYLSFAKFLLMEIHKYRPQLSCEGCHNIWIIKPAHCSRGRGIRMAAELSVIMNWLDKVNSKYVIQKYIEEPMLIYETKFDIRQYYLVTSTYPLVVWMYKDCYLKFSSQKYNLQNYHESIHLTNNAVQRKYKICRERNTDLPQNNMWDLEKYKEYLSMIGKNKVWDNIIYPGMKKSIIGIMLSCQDSLPVSKNRFELYGCDFILDKAYKPWLIEINSCPDLNPTTQVTAKICPAAVSDIIKVVIDHARDSKSPTGKFECIYSQPMTIPKYGGASDLLVRGYTLHNEYFYKGNVELKDSYDNVDIEKERDMKCILEKLKRIYATDIMVEPDDDSDSNLQKDRCTQNTESDYELSETASVINGQVDELMERIGSQHSDSTKPLHSQKNTYSFADIDVSLTQNAKSETDMKSLLKRSESRFASADGISVRKSFSFSKLEDGARSIIGTNSITRFNYSTDTLNTKFKKLEQHLTIPNNDSFVEATSRIMSFIGEKEREHSVIII